MAKLVLQTSLGPETHTLGSYTTIGRDSANHIPIIHPTVSKVHCRITYEPATDAFAIEDLGSTNGTFVNERRVQQERLDDGCRLRIGEVACAFHLEGNEAGLRSAVRVTETASQIRQRIAASSEGRFLPESEVTDEATLRSDYEKLRLIYELQRNVGIGTTLDGLLKRILDRIFEALRCDQGVILLADRDGSLHPRAHRSRRPSAELCVSSTLLDYVRRERVAMLASDIMADERFKASDSIVAMGVRSSIAVPFLSGEELLGVMILDSTRSANAFGAKDLQLISTIANHATQLINNAILHKEVQSLFDSAMSTLSAVVDARHRLTAGHSRRVTQYALRIGEALGLSGEDLEALKYAALLHDVGKIGIPDAVLTKQGPFSDEERAVMNTHPARTREILETFHFPRTLKAVPDIAANHHEKMDGSGYPNRTQGDRLPLGARVLAVADVFDALTSLRDYPKHADGVLLGKEPMPLSRAFVMLRKEAGRHFDPKVVDAFFCCLPGALAAMRDEGHFTPAYAEEGLAALKAAPPK
jgi:putative nucleotidyltransferase with HDIG domain